MGTPPAATDVADLRSRVADARSAPLTPGDKWYAVAATWLARLASNDLPGPVDSSALAATQTLTLQPTVTPLRTDIVAGQDYELLPAATWDALVTAFGVTGPTFARHVIPGMSAGAERVELWPPSVRVVRIALEGVALHSLPETTLTVSVSTTLSAFKNMVRSSLQLTQMPDQDIRFFRLPDEAVRRPDFHVPLDALMLGQLRPELVDEKLVATTSSEPTLEMLQVDERSVTLALDVRNDGWWNYECDDDNTSSVPALAEPVNGASSVRGVFSNNKEDHWSRLQANSQKAQQEAENNSQATAVNGYNTATRAATSIAAKPPIQQGPRGLVGLQNLGNTCFMNSALQCMSNTPEVQEYFVSNVFHDEINRDNPLGNGGALAEAFGALLQRLWSPKTAAGTSKGPLSRYGGWHNALNPREFKFAVSRFAPQFAGYGQQDTQELLAFLLDGLHEDLNRIHKKPYIEAPDWEGGDDRALVEFARKQWDIYKARNDSLIVDLFQGQYKSTLVCPECNKVAIKFDPFMYLTLPIPNRRRWTGSIFFVPYDPTKPSTKLTLSVPQGYTIAQLRAKVGEAFGVNKDHLLAGEVWQRNIQKWYLDWDSVADIGHSDVAYFWELPVPVRLPPTKHSAFNFVRAITQSATDYERSAPASAHPAAEEWAILPVFTMLALVGNHTRPVRRGSKGNALPMGIPFFAAIPPEKKNNPEEVARVVEWQYTRYAQSPEELKNIVNPPAPILPQAEAASSAMDTTADGAVPAVTNAEEDTKSVIMGDVDATPEPDAKTPQAAVSQNPQEVPSEGSVVPDPVAAPPAPYKMYYLARRFNSPLPQSGQTYEEGGELLKERSERRRERSDWLSFEKKDNEGQIVQQAWPLVYTSGAVVCVWTTAAAKAAFIRGEQEVWGPYEEELDESATAYQGGAGRKSDLTLWDCLDEFCRSEQLGADDLWYCPSCKEHRQATKKFDLWKVPDILVVHLKRFSAARYSRDKIDDYVDFPITGLDLSDYVEGPKVISQLQKEGNNPISSVAPTAKPPSESYMTPPSSDVAGSSSDSTPRLVDPDSNDDAVASDYPIYDLYAVDNHYGGLGGGHYTACARNPEDGQWYYYDDSSVRPIKAEEAKTRAAYLLFYRRRTARPIGGKTRKRLDESIGSLASTDALPLPTPSTGSLVHGSSNLAPPLDADGLPEADAANDPYASSSSSDTTSCDDELLDRQETLHHNTSGHTSSSQSETDEPVRYARRTRYTVSHVPVTDDDDELEEATKVTDKGMYPRHEPMEVDPASQLFSTPAPSFYTK